MWLAHNLTLYLLFLNQYLNNPIPRSGLFRGQKQEEFARNVMKATFASAQWEGKRRALRDTTHASVVAELEMARKELANHHKKRPATAEAPDHEGVVPEGSDFGNRVGDAVVSGARGEEEDGLPLLRIGHQADVEASMHAPAGTRVERAREGADVSLLERAPHC